MKENKIINEEMTVLLRQLVMQNQISMAGHVLKAYFIRRWKTNEELATKYVRGYFFKYYPEQLERHLKRLHAVR
ncbi:hypothetical protein [Paenibacillus sabinae]|uniref:Uncharacterized protein n=1 Tax=Paenibacillus sabinae T27 TaxID=1268072 RepID=X4ZI67_9BACL|nr:hypothetical protein [Paenibacillus sabinae]AHV97067.1 hypothetical protein PSAB_10685 [Paenibacillus sabinae T27]